MSLGSTAISGLTNIIVQFLVAAALSTSEFGRFALGAATTILLYGLGRAVVGQVDLVRGDGARRGGAIGAALNLAILYSVVGLGSSVVFYFVGPTELFVVSVGVFVAGGLVWQDALRFRSFRLGRPEAAFLSDLLGLVLVVVAMSYLATNSGSSVGYLIGWWAAVVVSALPAMLILGSFNPEMRAGLLWFRTNRDLGLPGALEFTMQSGLPYALNWVLLWFGGLDAIAGYRLIQLCFAAVANLGQGLSALNLPRMARHRDPVAVLRTTKLESLVLLLATCGLTVTIALVPTSAMSDVFGPTWIAAQPFLVVGAIHGAVNALAVPNYGVLRLLQEARFSLVVRAYSVLGSLVMLLPSLNFLGPTGVAWALAVPALVAYVARSCRSRARLHDLRDQGQRIPLEF